MPINYFIEQLQAKGVKITPQRQEIIKVFLESQDLHLSAEEVHRRITVKFPSMSLDTVYRNLSMLQKLGILTELNFGDRKSLFEINNSQHHHHLICTKCGGSQEIEFCPLDFLDKQHIKNFKVQKHSFEIFGICANCMQ
ncbi:Fur family transcriptional regulator [Desulforamulus aeronauticus]|uniref:Fur family transcriptional regulator, zinc uptake regulator n=1 Tax=Desulforamulus aeronauticus DSM 10349 TaxID=1121421 RepID=A0A1M6VRL1_9FIRM|nr:Fur family transcriptional regulator [Desulforamulus aeronauticus]SHK84197.1 Fur family transcriptional regulator, zinc uptake regulator [Desulforamulus aeronauticus DSM 10349]